jgi:hypothetical protein
MDTANPGNPRLTIPASAAIFFLLTLGTLAAPASDPVPLITQPLVPDAAVPGGPQFTLTVSGTGFLSTSVVQWNGAALATQFISGSKLTATVPASDIAMPATASVTVSSPAPGGGVSNVVYLPITSPVSPVSFSRSDFDFGAAPYSVLAGDFNGDGKLDVAATDIATNSVEILLGNGNGSFQSPVSYPTCANPMWAATGDFNRDGKLDLAAACNGTVSILLGNGDGTFQSHVDYTVGAQATFDLVADFNGDGNADLAVVDNGSAAISILLGNGDGTFQNQVEYSAQRGVSGATVGDFNGDGILDLAAANDTGSISLFLGKGDGTFQNQMVTTVPGTLFSVVTADFNGDGKLDLAASDYNGAVDVLFGEGDGTFQAPVAYSAGQGAIDITTSDLNADGKLDLVTANLLDNTVSLLLGNGDGTFQAAFAFSAGTEPQTQAVGDFDENGTLDIIVASLGDDDFALLLQSTASFSPGNLDFGHQPVGTTSAAQTSTFTNYASATLNITSISITGANGGDFNQTNNCGNTLAVGTSCTFTITFTPSAFGTRSAGVEVTDNAPGSPQPLFLSGFGDAPQVQLIPNTLPFGFQVVNTSSPTQQVELLNSGTETLTISSIGVSGDFAIYNPCPSTLAAGVYCMLTVVFKPKGTGVRTGAITVTDNAGGSPQTVPLTGIGTFVSTSPASLNFGNVPVGHTSVPENVTVTNNGKVATGISNIRIGGGFAASDFAETNNCGSSIAAGASCTITVTFTPREPTSLSAALGMFVQGAVREVPLSGTGTK